MAESDPEQTDGTSEYLVVGCRTGSALACSSREDVAVFVGKECCVRLFKSLKRLNPLISLRCYAAVIAV